jgi:NHLM bacteriocin system ABC transporter peptidase/ATP-binding protein
MSDSLGKPRKKPRRVHCPTVLQMEAVECGAAALAIVLGFHGRIVSLEELRIACGVSRDGTNAANIIKAARGDGLEAKGFSKQPHELTDLPLPMIVFWNFNHFVVVEGFGQGRVYLNDPGEGRRVVTDAEFNESFTGVVLVFEPGPAFRRGGCAPGLLEPLRRRLRGSENGLLYVVLASLALALTGLAGPVFLQIFVDQCLVRGRLGWVGPLLVAMGVAAALRAGLTWLQRAHLLRLETKLALATSYRFFRHLLRLPAEFFTQRYAGEIGSRVEINDRIAQLLSGELAANMLNALMVLSYLALMLYYDVALTTVGVVLAALNLVALRYVSERRRDLNRRALQERGNLTGTSMAGLQAIETLKATGSESDFFSRWAGCLAKVMVADQRMGVLSLWLGAVPPLLSTISMVSILGVGALRVMNGHMTLGMLVAFQRLMVNFMTPVNELVYLGRSLQEVEGEMNRLDDVQHHPTAHGLDKAEPPSTKREEPVKLSGQLELRNVSYGYSRFDPPLLRGVSLLLRPGSRVALVGPSASGKSTLARLIAGLYQPWSGEVLLDNRRREQLPRALVSNSLAMVDQDIFLFEGTVHEVLTLWDETIPEEDVVQAAKDACIHEDIATRPGGYASKIEEGGVNFSGGQRQRLEIARALVVRPTLLVLDEATSALDPITEKQIDENLRRRGCTCVIVAHRLSTIRDCDEILVLDYGRIVQRGSHEELMSLGGLYCQLIRS